MSLSTAVSASRIDPVVVIATFAFEAVMSPITTWSATASPAVIRMSPVVVCSVAVGAQLAADLGGVDVAHQPADELLVPAQRLAAAHLLAFDQRLVEVGGQIEGPQTLGFEAEQGFAQGLQVVGVALAAGFAGGAFELGHSAMITARPP